MLHASVFTSSACRMHAELADRVPLKADVLKTPCARALAHMTV